MDKTKLNLVKDWLIKANHYLASARKLAGGRKRYLDTAIYHCHQAAEKAVKGFLVFHDQRFEKSHDIQYLINLAISKDEKFSDWLDVAEHLTP